MLYAVDIVIHSKIASERFVVFGKNYYVHESEAKHQGYERNIIITKLSVELSRDFIIKNIYSKYRNALSLSYTVLPHDINS